MKLIVGLGNPGKKYLKTRHNLGFQVIDALATSFGLDINKKAFQGLYTSFMFHGEVIYLFKPQTYMNLSGQAVSEIKNFFKIENEDVFVVYDDMDLEPGIIKMRNAGTSAGHNGMQDIINHLKTTNIKRLKIGIGKPPFIGSEHVLTKPTKEEVPLFNEAIDKAVLAIKEFIISGFEISMTKFN